MTWIGKDNDFTAKNGDYILRVGQMGYDFWYWCIHYKYNIVDHSSYYKIIANTEKIAKKRAENAMNRHLRERLNFQKRILTNLNL